MTNTKVECQVLNFFFQIILSTIIDYTQVASSVTSYQEKMPTPLVEWHLPHDTKEEIYGIYYSKEWQHFPFNGKTENIIKCEHRWKWQTRLINFYKIYLLQNFIPAAFLFFLSDVEW